MKKYIVALCLAAALVVAPLQSFAKSKRGVGFDSYGSVETLPAESVPTPVKRSRSGATGSSDVPVYRAKSRGLRFMNQKKAAAAAMDVDTANGRPMRGVPIYAGDVAGSLRIVRYDRHVFGVVDRLTEPAQGTSMSDRELGRALSQQVARRTGCALGGSPVMQLQPGHLGKLSVPLSC